MWVFFLIGVVLGNSHHSRSSLICISVALAVLFLAMSVVLPKKKQGTPGDYQLFPTRTLQMTSSCAARLSGAFFSHHRSIKTTLS
eukprot:s6101_g1.t1